MSVLRAAAAALLVGVAACAERLPAEPDGLAGALAGQDCVVILLDALRADHLGSYGAEPSPTPRLDALAEGGVRMARASSQASWTLPSTASLFTGLYQETHGLFFGIGVEPLLLVEEALTLADLFSEAGYATHAWSQNTFASDAYGLDQGFDDFTMVNFWVHDGDDMADEISALLAAPSESPRFVYAHFRRPHTPYDPPGGFPRQNLVDNPGGDPFIQAHNTEQRRTAAELQRHHALYRAGLSLADAHVGRLLDALDLERTLVVLLSDHGEAFDEHGKLGHNWLSFQEYVHIPWLMSHPRLARGEVVEEPVMTVDVLPTLAELFALDVDGLSLHGSSLVPRLEGGAAPRRAAVFSSSRVAGKGRQQLAAFDGRFKLLRQLPGGTDRLFDLEQDPGETIDVSALHAERAAALGELLGKWQSSQRAGFASATGKLDADALENLRRLGYVGSDDGD